MTPARGSKPRLRIAAIPLAVLGVLAVAVAVAPGASAWRRPSRVRVLTVGSWHGRRGEFRSIQAAVDAARPGDWILVGPGDYHERGDRDPANAAYADEGAGVMVTKPGIHIRGMSRTGVVVDGTLPGSPRCSSRAANQDLGPLNPDGHPYGRNGIEAFKASGVSVENLTVCNFLSGAGDSGNEIWFNGGDGSGQIGMGAYLGRYLSATSTYYGDTTTPAAAYGLFASNSRGPGLWAHTYASNMNDSSYYIGACPDCNATVTDAHAQYSVLGYSGTNSGGRLVLERSEWDHNQAGIVTNSQNNDDAPSPQLGLCPGSQTRSCTVFRDNYVHDNNNPNVPSAGTAALGPVGSGIVIAGGRFDTIARNRVVRNGAWGVLLVPFPDSGTPPPISHCEGGITNGPLPGCYYDDWGNRVLGNTFSGNGFFGNPTNGDLAEISGTHTPGNCYRGNRARGGGAVTSTPPDVQTTHADCAATNQGEGPFSTLGIQVICNTQLLGPCPPAPGMDYPRPTKIVMPPLPRGLRSMRDPCAGVPRNAFCTWPRRWRGRWR